MERPTTAGGGIAALIMAAGRGTRAQGIPESPSLSAPLPDSCGDPPKQYCPIAGRPLIRHALSPFLAHPGVDRIVPVIGAADAVLYHRAIEDSRAAGDSRLLPPVVGGRLRQESVYRGLVALAKGKPGPPDIVLIHDAARPFVPRALLDRLITGLAAPGAPHGLVPVLDMVDSLVRIDPAGDIIGDGPDRTGLCRVQTPQAFRFADILRAHEQAAGHTPPYGDDAGPARAAGLAVGHVRGEDTAFKITVPADFSRATRFLDADAETRCATGFDVHRFTQGDGVTLCGAPIPHDRALAGHSDADVAIHAICDALLGCIAAGDIGSHFPPGEARWKDAPSRLFLTATRDMITARSGRIIHLDLTLICERPAIAPHRSAMTAQIAAILDISPDRVSIKATTSEGLGFTGRGEGIAAQATATLRLPRWAVDDTMNGQA